MKMQKTYDDWFKDNKDKCLDKFGPWIKKYQFGDVNLEKFTRYLYFAYLFDKDIKRDYDSWKGDDGRTLSKTFKTVDDVSFHLFESYDNPEYFDGLDKGQYGSFR